ncbi:hypothetical protein JCM8208_006463 [Rhodotorula glutinis]
MKPTSLLVPLAILLFPSSALATPPPELQDLLSAASAAHTALPIPAGVESSSSSSRNRMVRRRAAKLDDEAERVKERLGGVVVLPPGHFNHTVTFNGTKYNGATMSPTQIPHRHRLGRRNFWDKLEAHFGFGPSATASAEATKGTGVVDKGKAQSDDGRHYWYVEDSDDQKHWREKDGKEVDAEEKEDDKVKRDVSDFFEDIASEVNADGATSDVASATSSIASQVSSAASSTSTAAAAATSSAAAASGNSTDAVWYNPTTWDDAITAEYRETKHKISELSVLSKVGLAVLVLVASVLLFALIYCACKLNSRRRRRNAAERAQLNLAAATAGSAGSSRSASTRGTPGSGRGQRGFETGRDTSIPVMSYVGSSSASTSTSSSASPLDKGKAKAGTKEKKGKGWSLLSRD